jgi:hypothetical protein
MIAGSRQNEGSKRFFFEKKNQKTFYDLGWGGFTSTV